MSAPTMDPPVIRLDNCLPNAEADVYTPERIVAWLRASGGSLGERKMKCAAADTIETTLRR